MKIRNYVFCQQENPDWCVPASLQTVLKSRGIEIGQNEIAENFPENPDGFCFNLEFLENFLGKISPKLKCSFYSPHKYVENYKDCDIFLRDAEGDVLAAYDAKFHQREKNGRMGNNHLSIVLDYNFSSSLIRLVDAAIPLPILVQHMNSKINKDYGFYLIS